MSLFLGQLIPSPPPKSLIYCNDLKLGICYMAIPDDMTPSPPRLPQNDLFIVQMTWNSGYKVIWSSQMTWPSPHPPIPLPSPKNHLSLYLVHMTRVWSGIHRILTKGAFWNLKIMQPHTRKYPYIIRMPLYLVLMNETHSNITPRYCVTRQNNFWKTRIRTGRVEGWGAGGESVRVHDVLLKIV